MMLTCPKLSSKTESTTKVGVIDSVYKQIKWSQILGHQNYKISETSAQLEYEVKTYSRLSTMLWYGHIHHMYSIHKAILADLRSKHKIAKRDQILQQIVGSYINDPDLGSSNFADVGSNHKNISRDKRKNQFYSHLLSFADRRIEDEKYITKAPHAPIFFEDSYVRGDTEESFPKKQSLDEEYINSLMHEAPVRKDPQKKKYRFAVLCHGFQGSHLDMLKLAHYFRLFNHEVTYICSRCYEQDSSISIAQMGNRLAKEVESHISMYLEDGRLGSISFVGHSLGGLVLRAALPHLEKYRDYMKTLITFSSPHLGVSSGDSMLVETGKFVLIRLLYPHILEKIELLERNGSKR